MPQFLASLRIERRRQVALELPSVAPVIGLLLAASALAEDVVAPRPSVFELPQRHAAYLRLQPLIPKAIRPKDFEQAERLGRLGAQAAELLPQDSASLRNRDCKQLLNRPLSPGRAARVAQRTRGKCWQRRFA